MNRLRGSALSDTHRLLQVGDEDADDQRVYVNVVHAALRGLGGGLYRLVNGLFSGAVGGAVVGVVGKALGHLILTGGGAPGHTQQARRIQLGRRKKEERSDKLKLFIRGVKTPESPWLLLDT